VFALPSWVSDPFAEETAESPNEDDEAIVLGGRFRVETALKFSNRGGVYVAVDQETGNQVIAKEARPAVAMYKVDGRWEDAVAMLGREAQMLRRLAGCTGVPRLVGELRQWEHAFLVEEYMPGVTLEMFWASDRMLAMPFMNRDGALEEFLPAFRDIGLGLTRAVREIHARDVILADLSPRNVLIEPETMAVRLIDFEGAVHIDDTGFNAVTARLVTPGYCSARRTEDGRVRFEDDWYAVGALLLSGIVRLLGLEALLPSASASWIEEAGHVGFPRACLDVVTLFRQGEHQRAEEQLCALRGD
jgi:serine/threonine protein kinase